MGPKNSGFYSQDVTLRDEAPLWQEGVRVVIARNTSTSYYTAVGEFVAAFILVILIYMCLAVSQSPYVAGSPVSSPC